MLVVVEERTRARSISGACNLRDGDDARDWLGGFCARAESVPALLQRSLPPCYLQC